MVLHRQVLLHMRNVVSQLDIPVWKSENCIQCNRCAYVCPHAVIRPVALTEEDMAKAPEGLKTIDMIWYARYEVHNDCISL